jgi:AcrR family transcriptional regulator
MIMHVHSMSERKRSYRMRERAKAQEETRQRIVEATMHLHEELGPRTTTISAIAERAGVQRLTVYRHFPDETAVFEACTSHWLSLNPTPDPQKWKDVQDGAARLQQALAAFYAYYRRTQRMWTVSFRDVEDVPALQGPMKTFEDFVASVAQDLARSLCAGTAGKAARVTIHHALYFPTWLHLEELRLPDRAKVQLVANWLDGVLKSH